MAILMCRPDYFGVEYEINPWMHVQNAVDYDKAQEQWDALFDAYKELHLDVDLGHQLDVKVELFVGVEEGIPLLLCLVVINRVLDVHPGVDLVFNPEVVGAAHQYGHCRTSARAGRSPSRGAPAPGRSNHAIFVARKQPLRYGRAPKNLRSPPPAP